MKTNVRAEVKDSMLYLVISDGFQKQRYYKLGPFQEEGLDLLDANARIPHVLLPYTALEYKGALDASGATYPSNPTKGDTWVVSVAGTISGIAYTVGDLAIYNGTGWDKIEGDLTSTEIVTLLDGVNLTLDAVLPSYTASADIADDIIAKPDGSDGVAPAGEGDLIAGVNNTGDTIASAASGVLVKGKCTAKCGEDDIAGGVEIVVGPNGKIVDYKGTEVSLMSAVQGAAADDFTAGVLSGAEKIKLVSSDGGDTMTVDVYGYTGTTVTKETVTLNGTEAVLTEKADWDEILAVYVSSNMTGNLTISDPSDNVIKTLTTPTTGWYGAVATDDSDDADGHMVYIKPTGANTAKVAILGTAGDDSVKYELVTMNGAGVKVYSADGFKTITHLLMGTDGIATETYDIKITANDKPQGYTRAAVSSGAVGKIVLY